MRKLNPIAAAIEDLDSNIAQIRAQKTALRQHRKAISRAIAPLIKARNAGILRFNPSLTMSGKGTEFWAHRASIATSTVRLESFKDEGLRDLLAHYIGDEFSVECTDNAENLNRDFTFTKRLSEHFVLEVLIFAYVKSDSPACKKVLKSTKTETVVHNEYEIVCE